MTRQFNVASMEVVPKLDSHDDVVITIRAIYGDSRASNFFNVQLNPPGPNYIPISSITKELALEWLLAKVDEPVYKWDTDEEGEPIQVPGQTLREEFDKMLDKQIALAADQPYSYGWDTEEAPAE